MTRLRIRLRRAAAGAGVPVPDIRTIRGRGYCLPGADSADLSPTGPDQRAHAARARQGGSGPEYAGAPFLPDAVPGAVDPPALRPA